MAGQWKEVVKLAFKGPRFQDHALDLGALTELSQFQKIVAETAKALWRAQNPDRERLPKKFEDRTRLCLRRIEEGSAVAPLEVYLEEPESPELFQREPTEVSKAIELAQRVFDAVEKEQPLPEDFPKTLVPEYERWGLGLGDQETIEIITGDKRLARITKTSRARLAVFDERPYVSNTDIMGEVLEADVRQGRFQIWRDERTCVTVSFSPQQEVHVTDALKNHESVRLQVQGKGEFSPSGKLLRITHVEDIRQHPAGELPYDSSARPIEDVLAELASEIPQEDWNKLPNDLIDNLDHYLYGTPKR